MAKKKGGKSKGYRSAGERPSVAKKTSNAVRAAYVASGQRLLNQLAAFRKGKNVSVTIQNPNSAETNKPFIKVPGHVAFKPEFKEQKK